jgi:hypothetical protein
MDGVKLREVSSYDIVSDRRIYRWDALVGDRQVAYMLDNVQPGQLRAARRRARRMLAGATDSLPLLKGCTYI